MDLRQDKDEVQFQTCGTSACARKHKFVCARKHKHKDKIDGTWSAKATVCQVRNLVKSYLARTEVSMGESGNLARKHGRCSVAHTLNVRQNATPQGMVNFPTRETLTMVTKSRQFRVTTPHKGKYVVDRKKYKTRDAEQWGAQWRLWFHNVIRTRTSLMDKGTSAHEKGISVLTKGIWTRNALKIDSCI